MIWPGLNAPILRGKELVTQEQLPEDKDRQEKLIKMRDQQNFFRREKISPLDRGWSGPKLSGRSIGPPDPIRDGIQYILFSQGDNFQLYIFHFREI